MILAVSFGSAGLLWLLLVVPLAAAAYLLAQRRRPQYAARFTNLALLSTVVPRTPNWRRHVPPVIYLTALATLLFATARPAIVTADPTQQATVMLAIDVSGSMIATDVQPTRLAAAQSSARTFLEKVPKQVKVGLVAFSSQARVLAAPTTDRQLVSQALDSLSANGATAMGDGILAALTAGTAGSDITGVPALPGATPSTTTPPAANAAGQIPRVVLLLSDGKNTVGADPLDAADEASQAKVRIYTVALGTPDGVADIPGPGGRTQEIRVPPDPDTLQAVAQKTGGTFFNAPSADALKAVYANLGSKIGSEKHRHEITAWFAGGAIVLLLAGGALSLLWFSRFP
jgi:Ca-activated chloride channel family protein